MRNWIAAALVAAAATAAQAAVKEEPVTYKDGAGTTLKGFVVYDDAVKGKRPGIVVVHEWWGITKHTHSEARRFAQHGYTAFIADMYGDAKTADNPKDATNLMKGLMSDPVVTKARFDAARDELAKQSTVDANRIAASGYCMGGAVVLNMARAGEPLAAVAAFHPGLGGYRAGGDGVKAKVLVLNGADDPFNKPEQIDAFKKDMDAAKADYKFINYPGAVHAFTNPEATEAGKKFNLPLAYNAKVDKESKAEADKLFAAALKK
ncbi:MAG: dienelactone hydrolase family protein [Betaproteobacteria bacterium]|nr:dienelactone hydrolase family protein [Betaproteobacteria bacterium]